MHRLKKTLTTWLIYAGGMTAFAFSYTPKFTDIQTAQLLNIRIDAIVAEDEVRAEEFYTQLQDIYIQVEDGNIEPWKLFVLTEMISHLETTYINPPQQYDFVSDDSLTKYVTRDISYDYPEYLPEDLEILYSSDAVSIAHSPNAYHTVSERILPDLQDMAWAYYAHFGTAMQINSGWRSYEYQRDAFTQQCREAYVCAYPGHSEHQSWLAVDIGNLHGERYTWMANNAHLYGFHQSYQHGFEVDHYHREDRHWRYLGVELATELHESGQTFTQWRETERQIAG